MVSVGGFHAQSVAREPEAAGIERGQAQAIARAIRSSAEARDEDLVKLADLESVVAVLRTDTDRALRSQGVGIVAAVAARRFLAV